MKRGIIIAILLFGTVISYAQHSYYDIESTRKIREYMVMDGAKPDFQHAEQLSPTRLIIGMPIPNEKGEGIYELRADSCIWLVERRDFEDIALAVILREPHKEAVVFAYADPDISDPAAIEAIGTFDPETGQIFSSSNSLLATIDASGEVLNPDGTAYLRIDKADRKLVAFFLLHFYLPRYAPAALEN